MIILSAAAIISGCRADHETGRPEDTKLPVKVSLSSDNVFGTGFVEGDKAGLFVVNGPGSLSVLGSLCFNTPVAVGPSGHWKTDETLNYPHPEEPASLYCVYPYSSYDGEVPDAHALRINVNADQSNYRAYRTSDILWGKKEGEMPSKNGIEIKMKHIASRLRIVLKTGAGWDSEGFGAVSVHLRGFCYGGRLNVENGELLPEGISGEIEAHDDGDSVFSAFLLPQPEGGAGVIRINAGKEEVKVNVAETLIPGKDHTCTVTLNRAGGKFNVAINGWETDDNDYGGSV